MADNSKDKWLVNAITNAIVRVVGRKAGTKISASLIASGIMAKVVQKLKSFVGNVKSGKFTELLNYITSEKIAAKNEGKAIPSIKDLIKRYGYELEGKPEPKKWEDMTKVEKAKSAGKKVAATAGLVGAVITAWQTVSKAIEYGKDDLNRADKSAWDWIWDTSIPGATANMIAGWFGHGRKINSTENKEAAEEMKRQGKLALIGASDEQLESKNRIARNATDLKAEELGMMKRPTNPTAETEWAKEVERMSKRNFKKDKGSNDPAFYMRGNAKTLNAGTLTWTTVKSNDREGLQSFAAAVLINTTLNIPTQKAGTTNVIHPRIKEQITLIMQGLRGKNTGAYQYNEEDVYNYIITLASIIARFKQIKRNLSILNKSNAFVSREAEIMFNACYNSAAAYSNAIPDRPNYISRMNALANVINTYAVPNLSLISKWNYNAEKVFTDFSGRKPIIGIFKAYHYPVIVPSTGKIGVGTDNYTTINAEITALEGEVAGLIDVISNLTANPGVFSKISSDFIKLLGANKATFENVPFCSITDVVEVKYDRACVDQLRNAMIVGKGTSVTSFASYDGTTPFVMVNATTICSNPSLVLFSTDTMPGTYDANGKFAPWVMTFDDEAKEKSGPENIEMIQYTFTSQFAFSGGVIVRTMLDTPAAVIEQMVVHYFAPGSNTIGAYLLYGWHVINDASADGYMGLFESQCNRQIDFLPSMILSSNGVDVRIAGVENDIDNYTYMNDNQFFNMNNVSTYSLFYLYTPEELNIKGIVDVY